MRVGLEDNFYLPDGSTMAKSNGDLCTAGVMMMKEMGVMFMNLEEMRQALGMV